LDSTWHSITEANRTILVLAAIVNALSLIGKAIRWWIFLRPVGASSFWLALKATFAGAGLNNILVANGGEAARVVFVARAAHVPSAKVLATLALERMFELIGYIVMLALAVSFLELPHMLARTRPIAWAALAGVVVLMIYLVRRPERAEVAVRRPSSDGARKRAPTSGASPTPSAESRQVRASPSLSCYRLGSGRFKCGPTASPRGPPTSTSRSSGRWRRFSP
jgi:uncharacterized protein (TIRG00374 family)